VKYIKFAQNAHFNSKDASMTGSIYGNSSIHKPMGKCDKPSQKSSCLNGPTGPKKNQRAKSPKVTGLG